MHLCVVTAIPMTARLYSGTSMGGRLEILIDGEWNTVCQDGFKTNEINVACKMMGFNRSVNHFVSAYDPKATMPRKNAR